MGMINQLIGSVTQDGNSLLAHHLAIERVLDIGCSRHYGLIFGMSRGGLQHQRQIIADFTHARTGDKGNNGTANKAEIFDEIGKNWEFLLGLRHLLHSGVTHIFCLVTMLAVPLGLKGQDTVHVIHISTDVTHAPLLPHPHLGRNEIMHRYAQVVGKLCHLEVK